MCVCIMSTGPRRTQSPHSVPAVLDIPTHPYAAVAQTSGRCVGDLFLGASNSVAAPPSWMCLTPLHLNYRGVCEEALLHSASTTEDCSPRHSPACARLARV